MSTTIVALIVLFNEDSVHVDHHWLRLTEDYVLHDQFESCTKVKIRLKRHIIFLKNIGTSKITLGTIKHLSQFDCISISRALHTVSHKRQAYAELFLKLCNTKVDRPN